MAADQAQGPLCAQPMTCWRATARCSRAPASRRWCPSRSRSAWTPHTSPPRASPSRSPPGCDRCWPRAARHRPLIRAGAMSRSLTAIAVLAFIDQGQVRLQSRRGLDLTRFFPELAADLAAQPGGRMLLDGEIVALDAGGRPSFNALQNRAQLKSAAEIAAAQRATPVVLVCFDLLHFAGVSLRDARLRRSAPLPGAVPAAGPAPAAGALRAERGGAVPRLARSRLRRHHGQAPRRGVPARACARVRGSR